MIKSDETCGSFSSSSTSDTFPGNNNVHGRENVSEMFSNLFIRKIEIGNSPASRNNQPDTTVENVAILKKNNFSNYETETEEKTKRESIGTHDTLSTLDCSAVNESDASLPLSTGTVIVDRSKSATSDSKVLVPILTVPTDDELKSIEEEKRNPCSSKFVDPGVLKRARSHSKIPVSTKRLITESQKKDRLFSSTEKYFKGQPASDKELLQKRSEKISTKKYDHVKSKVAAYIHRPTKSEYALRGNARSMSPINCKMKNDNLNVIEDEIKRLTSSRTSLETYACEYKMPSADASFNLDKSENPSDSHLKIRKHLEITLELNRKKLENERIIAEHHQVIAKQHQEVLEHSARANDNLQKAITLLLNKGAEKS